MERCLECKWRTCAENKKCDIKNYKYENPYKKLENYIYENLRNYGNAVLDKKDYKRLGETKIIADLELNGFKNIKIIEGHSRRKIVWAETVKKGDY